MEYKPSFNPTFANQSFLERNTIEGDSPVGEAKRMWWSFEYCSSDIEQEVGGHQPPTLNTF